MALLRRLLRILRFTVLILLALLVGAVSVLTLTGKGRENLAAMISSMASSADSKVRIGGIAGIWSGHLTLDHVVLEDADGPWLVARGVALDWSPLSLVSSTFKADTVSAARVEIARLPKPAEGGGEGGLPVSIDIGRFDLPEIAVGWEIAGGVARLSANGSLVAYPSPLNVKADITVARSDGVAGDLDAAIHFAPGENRLDVDIRASEPAGGILANFLKLPGTPRVDVLVSGSGPAADWKGTGTFAVDGKVVTSLAGTHRLTDRGSRFEAKGDGAFEPFLPQALRPLLAGTTVFDIAGTVLEAGGLEVERAEAASAAIRANAKGAIDPEGTTDFAFQLEAVSDPVALAFGAGEQAAAIRLSRATARAFGAGAEPMIDIALSLPEVASGGNRLESVEATIRSDGLDLARASGPLAVEATAGAAVLDNAALQPLAAGPLKLVAAVRVADAAISIDSGSLTTATLASDVSGTISRTDGTLALDLKADVAREALPEAARGALGDRVAVSGAIARDASGGFSAKALVVKSGDLSVQGSGSFAAETIRADLNGTFADLGRIADGTKGALEFTLAASGNARSPDLSLTLSSDRIETAGRSISGLSLTARGVASATAPSADIALSASVAGEALAGSAVLRTEAGKREIKGLSLTLGQNRLSGDLVLDADFVPGGAIDFTLPDIGPLAALALETAEGDIRGTVRFAMNKGVPQATIEAATASLSRGDLAARDVSVNAVVASYLSAPAISGTVRAASVTSGGTDIRNVDVALTRDGQWTGFSGGAAVNAIPATASGRAKFVDGAATIELSAGAATIQGLKAALARPTTVVVKGGETALDKLALAIGGGTVTVSGTAGARLDLAVTVGGVSAAAINSFVPALGATGTISGSARVAGQPSSPDVGYSIDWKGAQTSQTRSAGFGAMAINSSGELSGGLLKFDASVGDGSGLALKGGGSVNTGGTRALALDFAGKVPFGFLTQRLAAQGLSLSGAADVSLQLRGAAASPDVGGRIRATGARFLDARSGIAVGDISADIAIAGGTATVNRLSGTLSTGGSLTAGGTVGIDAARGFPADLTVKISDGRYTDGRVVTATLSGDLSVKGPLASAPTIAGVINLGKTVITVPEKLPGSLAALDVKHKNASEAVRAQDEALRPATASGSGGGGLNLDLQVNAPQQIFIQGRGLDAELGGSLKLVGPAAAPQATGQFTMRRGRLSILGKRLTFTRGTLGFSGSLVPYLDLAADSSATDATVTVLVTGQATNPKFTFSSIPALPEDEVLARLIFGRSMSRLSPVQIAQLASAAAQLAGVGGSTSLLDTLRGKIGVDDLDVKTDEATGDTAVSAGKYLNDRTYVTIEKGQKSGSGKATIDLNVGRGVKLRGEAGEDGKAKGGIFFEREY